MANSLNNLAVLYRAMGRYAEAEPLYQPQPGDPGEAARARPPRRGHQPEQPGGPVRRPGALGRGGRVLDRARRVVRRHIARVLPALAETEQFTFLKANDEDHLHIALSLALARRDDPEAVARSAGWVLNGKAVAQEALAERALLARDRNDPAAARLARPCGSNWPP